MSPNWRSVIGTIGDAFSRTGGHRRVADIHALRPGQAAAISCLPRRGL